MNYLLTMQQTNTTNESKNNMTKPQRKTIDIATRYRTFEVKYLGATNTRGARYKIVDLRRGNSLMMSYDYSFSDAQDQALSYLESIGIPIEAMAMTKDSALLLSSNFQIELK